MVKNFIEKRGEWGKSKERKIVENVTRKYEPVSIVTKK